MQYLPKIPSPKRHMIYNLTLNQRHSGVRLLRQENAYDGNFHEFGITHQMEEKGYWSWQLKIIELVLN